LLSRSGRRHRGDLDRSCRSDRKLDIGLGGLGRNVDLVLPDLAVALGRHLVAGPLIGDHLRKRLSLRRIGLLILRRRHRRCRRVRLLVLRRRCVSGRALRPRCPVHRSRIDRRRRLRWI
jgi:hypothetical protein